MVRAHPLTKISAGLSAVVCYRFLSCAAIRLSAEHEPGKQGVLVISTGRAGSENPDLRESLPTVFPQYPQLKDLEMLNVNDYVQRDPSYRKEVMTILEKGKVPCAHIAQNYNTNVSQKNHGRTNEYISAQVASCLQYEKTDRISDALAKDNLMKEMDVAYEKAVAAGLDQHDAEFEETVGKAQFIGVEVSDPKHATFYAAAAATLNYETWVVGYLVNPCELTSRKQVIVDELSTFLQTGELTPLPPFEINKYVKEMVNLIGCVQHQDWTKVGQKGTHGCEYTGKIDMVLLYDEAKKTILAPPDSAGAASAVKATEGSCRPAH